MSTFNTVISGFVKVEENAAKQWAKSFDNLTLFEQIQTLYALKDPKNSIEIQFQLNSLLLERVQKLWEDLGVEEKKLLERMNIKTKVKSLCCGEKSPDGKYTCGLPASHTKDSYKTKHQSKDNMNIRW